MQLKQLQKYTPKEPDTSDDEDEDFEEMPDLMNDAFDLWEQQDESEAAMVPLSLASRPNLADRRLRIED